MSESTMSSQTYKMTPFNMLDFRKQTDKYF
jgi:hypothetical protein